MLEVDGSEGGGQLLRRSLALAALTDRAVRVTDVRGDRPEPGLKSQHLAAVRAITAATGGTVDGDAIGSTTVTFEPGTDRTDSVEATIETAGSITLVFDTLLPLAVSLDEPLTLTCTGGTEVAWSPSLATYRLVKLPLLCTCGLIATVERTRTGYYPAGGGQATLHLGPSALEPLAFRARGPLQQARISSRASRDLADSEVARRQADAARTRLEAVDIDVIDQTVASAATRSTGSAITVALEYEQTRAGFDALGEPGTPAETVGNRAVEQALTFHRGDGNGPQPMTAGPTVDRHMADQLLLFLALAGGQMHIPAVTDHVESSIELLSTFGFEVTLDESAEHPLLRSRGTDR